MTPTDSPVSPRSTPYMKDLPDDRVTSKVSYPDPRLWFLSLFLSLSPSLFLSVSIHVTRSMNSSLWEGHTRRGSVGSTLRAGSECRRHRPDTLHPSRYPLSPTGHRGAENPTSTPTPAVRYTGNEALVLRPGRTVGRQGSWAVGPGDPSRSPHPPRPSLPDTAPPAGTALSFVTVTDYSPLARTPAPGPSPCR